MTAIAAPLPLLGVLAPPPLLLVPLPALLLRFFLVAQGTAAGSILLLLLLLRGPVPRTASVALVLDIAGTDAALNGYGGGTVGCRIRGKG